MTRIEVHKDQIAEFCRRHHIRKLALFGSVLRDDFGPESDIDVLVEFEQEHVPGMFALSGMEREVMSLFGRHKIDLRAPEELSRYFREWVVTMG